MRGVGGDDNAGTGSGSGGEAAGPTLNSGRMMDNGGPNPYSIKTQVP